MIDTNEPVAPARDAAGSAHRPRRGWSRLAAAAALAATVALVASACVLNGSWAATAPVESRPPPPTRP